MTATDERELRPVRPPLRTAHVTVYKKDGTPIPYPKGQIHRIEESEILFLDDPTADPDPGEAPKPKPVAKNKTPAAKTGSKK